jgi:hypothetical protein
MGGSVQCEVEMRHPRIACQIGIPAITAAGDVYPVFRIRARTESTLSATVLRNREVVQTLSGIRLPCGETKTVSVPGTLERAGGYEIRFQFMDPEGRIGYDSYYFTAYEPATAASKGCAVVYEGTDGTLAYAADFRGNRIPDFSHAGYRGGGRPIPDVAVRETLYPEEGDATERIQQAIDRLSRLDPDPDGFRGALLLARGTYRIEGSLSIRDSGIVLRGEGCGPEGTVLIAAGKSKRTLIEVCGPGEIAVLEETKRKITDLYVPVGSRTFHVESADGYKTGDQIVVCREGNREFIHEIAMDRITPRPSDPASTRQWSPFLLRFDRVITRIEGNRITVDAPVTAAIEHRWGGGWIARYRDEGRIAQVGVEGIRGISEFDPAVKDSRRDNGRLDREYKADEEHAWGFISLNHVKNAWVRDISAFHFAHFTVHADRGSKWVTVQDAATYDMISIITGGRRYPYFVSGQLALFQRLYVETARHAFIVNSHVCGPNVFLYGIANDNYGTSEPHHRWSVGGLFDNIRGPIAIQDRQYMGSGHGWSGANYVAWNTETQLVVQKPPTAQNWAIGHVGSKGKEAFAPREQGYWESFGTHVRPESLYLRQLEDRLGADAAGSQGEYSLEVLEGKASF